MTTRDQQIAAAVIDLDALQALAEAATPGPWDYDTERNDGEYGAGPDCSSGFESFCIIDERGQTLFDSLNSDAACVQEECDEDHFRAWDEVGERNAKFIAAANPAVILSLIDRLRKAEAALRFSDHIINGVFEGGDFDGGELQDLAIRHGLLKPTKMQTPCAEEGCNCAAFGDVFPTICFRKTYAAPDSADSEGAKG